MKDLRKLALITAVLLTVRVANAEPAAEAQAMPQGDDAAEVDLRTTDTNKSAENLPSGLGDFCFFANLPPADQKYKIVKKLKVAKGTYGGVNDILPKLAKYAQMRGADAIIDYTGSQRFGFWPWRMVRPVVRGIAIKWTDDKKVDCQTIGGTKLSTIMSTNQPPER